ncbi:hypothetical protein GXB81_18210 [Paraburkholderia sp. Ac-20336]|uniref:hypothetical protein n=1 Tax=Paraburkholderia sp. Ac-20336 TaxID=2703886 RepID=UPI00197FA59E|nr:hypothetical protein [Paraburkholderia sp. Ac-20336]MBN3804970.1 hypothetical protein [Paraburkholderia sp. Ac-20336]
MKLLGTLFFGLGTAIFLFQLIKPELAARLNMPKQSRPKTTILLLVCAAFTIGSVGMQASGDESSASDSDDDNAALYGSWECASTLPPPAGTKNGTVAFQSNGLNWIFPDGGSIGGSFLLKGQALTLGFGNARYHGEVTHLGKQKLIVFFSGESNHGLTDETMTCVRG